MVEPRLQHVSADFLLFYFVDLGFLLWHHHRHHLAPESRELVENVQDKSDTPGIARFPSRLDALGALTVIFQHLLTHPMQALPLSVAHARGRSEALGS